MASLRDLQERGTGKYVSRDAQNVLKLAFERDGPVRRSVASGFRLTFSAGRVVYRKGYMTRDGRNGKDFRTHERKETDESEKTEMHDALA